MQQRGGADTIGKMNFSQRPSPTVARSGGGTRGGRGLIPATVRFRVAAEAKWDPIGPRLSRRESINAVATVLLASSGSTAPARVSALEQYNRNAPSSIREILVAPSRNLLKAWI